MAKNTLNTTYRKINVDALAEDQFEEEVIEDTSATEGPNESQVTSLINSGKNEDALRCVLDNAPVLSKNQQVKDRAFALAMRVLLSFKSSSIEPVVSTLNTQQIDVLMKYLYKGFEDPTEESSKLLLVWHDKVFQVGGLGSIVRVLTDRKRIA